MTSLIISALPILFPVIKWLIGKALNSEKLTASDRKRLNEVLDTLNEMDLDYYKRGEDLENQVGDLYDELDDINSGEAEWPESSRDRGESDD